MNSIITNQTGIEEMQARVHDLRKKIAAHPFAHGLNEAHLTALAECAMETHFAGGELLFREGEFANRFYFLLEGEVALESQSPDGPVVIETLGAGDVLGWSWLFPPYYWHFAARAVKPTRAIFFYGTWLREHCEQHPALGYELIKQMAGVMIHRLQATRQKLGAARAAESKSKA